MRPRNPSDALDLKMKFKQTYYGYPGFIFSFLLCVAGALIYTLPGMLLFSTGFFLMAIFIHIVNNESIVRIANNECGQWPEEKVKSAQEALIFGGLKPIRKDKPS